MLQEFRHQLAEGGFEVQLDTPPDLPLVRADRTAIRLALGNLVDNAIALRRRPALASGVRGDGTIGHACYIEVRDRGVGIPTGGALDGRSASTCAGRLARASGSGLGLAIVNRIVTDHGGTFTLESDVGAGTTARLDLPAIEG